MELGQRPICKRCNVSAPIPGTECNYCGTLAPEAWVIDVEGDEEITAEYPRDLVASWAPTGLGLGFTD